MFKAIFGNEGTNYQEPFVSKMEAAGVRGSMFEAVAAYSLKETLGERATDAWLRGLSDTEKEEPALFADAMTRLFGPAAVALFRSIERNVDLGRFPKASETELLEAYILAHPGTGRANAIGHMRPLHEHRFLDEKEELQDTDEGAE